MNEDFETWLIEEMRFSPNTVKDIYEEIKQERE